MTRPELGAGVRLLRSDAERTKQPYPVSSAQYVKGKCTSKMRVGIITPSSNTALEPQTVCMLRDIGSVSVHFSRFRVTTISLDASALGQFHLDSILQAAELLADAKVDVIGWSGTAAGWIGFEQDQRLRNAITRRTGIPATSSVLALNRALRMAEAESIALVTPYTADVQERIVANYAGAGYRCVAERHLGASENFNFARVSSEQLEALLMEVAHEADGSSPALVPFCTNLHSAALSATVERKTGLRVFDATAALIWDALRIMKVKTNVADRWGSLFALG